MYTKCIDHMNLFKNSNLLNVQNSENSMENFVYQTYRSFGLVKKFEFVEGTNSLKFDGKSKNVPNHENSRENYVHYMYKLLKLVEIFVYVECTKS